MKKTECTFCKQISTPDYNKYEFGLRYPCKCQIVKDGLGFHLWGGEYGDPYESGVELRNIKYCPVCGRKLEE
ncbi:MAG: hypothetical protein ACLRXW_08150 [Negativibacillus massiliensis]|uniref:hypothetical protein n=1 Tax=Negativibacillus massiliensis TaxID=1871035 RepID=UPI0039A28C8C